VRRALAGAADARELDHLRRVNAHLVERIDDALRDRIVPAPGAQGGLPACVDQRFETDPIDLCGRHYSPPAVPALTRAVFFATSSPSCESTSSVMLRASMGRPL